MKDAISDRPAPDKFGILLRVGLFITLGWITIYLSATLMTILLGSRDTLFVISGLSSFAAASIANAIVVRIYERGRLADLGLGWSGTSLREFLTGLGSGAGAAVLILGGPLIVGVAAFERAPGAEHRWASLLFVGVVLLFGAAGEEMLFHGYAFQLLIRALGAFATILPASVLFGLAHLGNQNVNSLGVLNTAAWGALLGYAYLRTGALWMPIGLHFGWNFALPLLGANMSGFTMGVTGYALRWRVGDLWSGGGYGPEGSLLTTGIVAVLFFVVLRLSPERGT
jgi:membrane protease YdiL (CAAX protease family)